MSTREEKVIRRSPGTSTPIAMAAAVAVSLLLACISTGSAQPQTDASATPAEEGAVRRQQEEAPPREEAEAAPQQDDESLYEGIPAPAEAQEEDDELARPGESYLWGGRGSRRPDPTITAEGALTMFMRARNYRTIRILKSVMTPSLQASYDRDSARFNGKQNVRLSAFYFAPEDLKAVHYTGPKGAREADIYDATVRSLWTDQGELADRRLEVVRLAQEESGLWRVGRLDIRESDKSRFQEQIPSVTSLRKVLRAWHRRQTALAEPLLSESFVKEHAGEGEEEGLSHLFEGDLSLRHAAFEILEILWEEETVEATAHVDLYVTARNRFGALEPQPRRLNLVRVGAGWYVDSWEEREETESAGL
jgi:hypothetical protein